MINDEIIHDALLHAYNLLPLSILYVNIEGIIMSHNKAAGNSSVFVVPDIVGQYVGDVIGCKNACAEHGICGKTDFCPTCPIHLSISRTFKTRQPISNYLCNYSI
ncbi:MAG: hypothetical protein PF505_03720, partial [Vallitaleaceae bacterium]|nr:hypothetical protein [Vallitaleaceae bacterium]